MAANPMKHRSRLGAWRSLSGMTLMELLIVIVIVGILTGVAYPTYRKQVMRSKRTDAKVALQQAAQGLENCFTRFHSYDSPDCAVRTALKSAAGLASNDGYYRVTVGDLDDLTFTLTADPQGAQATDDTECGSFTLDQSNERDVSGTKSAADCWGK